MPWKESSVVKERTKFVLEWERRQDESMGGRVDMAELCRVHGVSRTTGYLWVRRFVEAGWSVHAMEDRSSRPHTSPTKVSQAMEDFIVAMRKQFPRSGPRMLRARLSTEWPANGMRSVKHS